MPLGMEVGLGPGHTVLEGTSSLSQNSTSPIFCPRLLWQPAGWIKMPLGMEVGLGPGHTVLDGDPALPQKGGIVAPLPHISAHVYR